MFYDKHAKILIMLVFAVLGVMIATQFRINEVRKASVPFQRAEEITERLKIVEKERNQLLLEIQRLQEKTSNEVIDREINMLKAYAGDTALYGPGVVVTVDDSKKVAKPGENANLYIIHDDDLLRIINELRAAGAEGIAINEERLTAISEIRCAGPTLSVNNNRFAPPYIIRAIGDAKSMENSLKMRGGVVETLKFWGIQVTVAQEGHVVLPPYRGTHSFEYAKIGEGEAK
ncbi:MAG TPA: DUF881 domain-containing protein [Candidatus Avacidaminococcus intestinavium]|uniref:DUF881 domain-containing protein n=1 Tax=Candidatus Avacidaminococcus intestinavium TaxID=2840684 RepID=A0A9D1SL27_9FIRM|nr:DUF881 domain-containing protein [Candidatus Avacidaminococcus intestinavium]